MRQAPDDAPKKRNPHDPHYEKIKVSTQDLVTTRMVKMVTMARLHLAAGAHGILLSPEELLLYREIRDLVSEWRSLVLGEEKP